MSRSTEFGLHLFLSHLVENYQADDPFAPITWSRDCAHIMSDSSSNMTIVVSLKDNLRVSYPVELLKGGLIPPKEIRRLVQDLLDQAEIETGLVFLIDEQMVSDIARDLSQYGQKSLSIVAWPPSTSIAQPRQYWRLTWSLASPVPSQHTLSQAWDQLKKDVPRSLGLFDSVFGPIPGRDAMLPVQIADWYLEKYLEWGHKHVKLQSWSELALVQFLEAASQTCMFEASEQVMSKCLEKNLLLEEVLGSAELRLESETGPQIQQTKKFVCRGFGNTQQKEEKRAGHIAHFNIRTGLFDEFLVGNFPSAQNAETHQPTINQSFLSWLPFPFRKRPGSLSSAFALKPPG